jgi:hypothetical protein
MPDPGDLWIVATVIGAAALGLALAYGRMRASKTTPAQEAARDAATREQYDPDGTSRRPDPDAMAAAADAADDRRA